MLKPHPFLASARPHTFDYRDLSLATLSAPIAPVDYPRVFMQDNAWSAEMYYQAQQPACGSHSGTWLKALLDSYESKPRKYTPRFTWIDIKTFDGIKPEDGTDMRSIFKSLANAGAADFLPLGNDVSLSIKDYANPKAITQAMRDNASPRVISTYGFENSISFESLKRAIYTHKGVLVRVEIGNEWWTDQKGTGSWQEKDILPLRPPKQSVGGHFIVLHSYDENYIYFANSFSTDWGRKGHGYFGPDYIKFVTNAGTVVDIPDQLIPTLIQTRSLAQQLLALLKKKLGLSTV